MKKGRLKDWLKKNGKDHLGRAIESVGEKIPIPVLGDLIEGIGEQLQDDHNLTLEQKKEAAELIKMELERFQVLAQDRESARKREIELVKANKKDWFHKFTGIIGLFSFLFVLIVPVLFHDFTHESPHIHQLFGMVEGIALTIFAYYFGGSKK